MGNMELVFGILFLLLGFPIGSYLAKITKEELKEGKKWFKLIILLGLIGAIVGLILREDVILFSFLFVVIVTSRSLGKGPKSKSR